uniref:(northern house mosquito) hypothetical protein n=1 Tax=Culex pipiens TaxID=7175 RepID=A0A8D8HAY4_CULPI
MEKKASLQDEHKIANRLTILFDVGLLLKIEFCLTRNEILIHLTDIYGDLKHRYETSKNHIYPYLNTGKKNFVNDILFVKRYIKILKIQKKTKTENKKKKE